MINIVYNPLTVMLQYSQEELLQWLQVTEEAIRRTPILQHAERKECLFTDGHSTAKVFKTK